ncbi:MAG: HEPN domain-containing protein [Gemmatimonadetes bacterium]|nr:HEPN domain-containing protein [Gemmatimonadota bacterium]
MKPSERFAPDDPREWMNRAQSDLIQAKNEVPGVYLEDLCFNAQQAAEKAIEAVMVLRGINFPYIHDLTRLMSMLEASGETIPAPVRRAAALTRYAVQTRYPSLEEPVTAQEYAEAVVRWAEERIL